MGLHESTQKIFDMLANTQHVEYSAVKCDNDLDKAFQRGLKIVGVCAVNQKGGDSSSGSSSSGSSSSNDGSNDSDGDSN
ncbi:hypothetical protein EON65_16845 [archaeon]|nr:MAG: hypothetical protein EON65_16845 [archaeon]